MRGIRRYDPFENINQEFNRMIERYFGMPQAGEEASSALAMWNPRMDVFEKEDAVTVKFDLPGMEGKDIQVTVDNNVLTVSGERRYEKETEAENCHRMECAYGTFSRSFTLPRSVDPTNIKANYKNGVLRLTMPKKEESKPRKIDIKLT